MKKVKVKKLREIKTVYKTHKHATEFDERVNELLKKGYRVGEFKIVEAPPGQDQDMLYARLELWA